MRKHVRYVGLVLLVLLAVAFQSCDSSGGSAGCLQANGWHGPFSLTTSHPISSGGYYYESYCVDVSAGTTYELRLESLDYYGVGLSIFEGGYEDEVLWTYSDLEDWDYRTAPRSGRMNFSVWISTSQLTSGPAGYYFYIAP
jgi:hypothetical protein